MTTTIHEPTPWRSRSIPSAALVAALLTAVTASAATAPTMFLTIGKGWAMVREERRVTVGEGEQDLVFDDIPVEADLSSFMLRASRVRLELREWSRPAVPSAIRREGDAVVWVPGGPAAGVGAGLRSVRCRVWASSASTDMPIELIYRVDGPTWSARYQAAVRGEQAEEKEPVSVDLSGLVRIVNPTQKAYGNARVALVGEEKPLAADPRSDPGFLALDEDSPLADLWREPEREPSAAFQYSLPEPVSIGPDSETDVTIIRTLRTPAKRVYSMAAEAFPLGGSPEGAPLRKWIVFRNTPAGRMGRALPPGQVQVFLGGMRTHLLQEARFPRTPENGDIRIDLGRADDVRGTRRSLGRSTAVAGSSEESFALEIRNLRDTDVVVEIDEKPSVTLEWTLVRSTKTCRETFRRLQFSTEVKARRAETIEYRLRIRQPEL